MIMPEKKQFPYISNQVKLLCVRQKRRYIYWNDTAYHSLMGLTVKGSNKLRKDSALLKKGYNLQLHVFHHFYKILVKRESHKIYFAA